MKTKRSKLILVPSHHDFENVKEVGVVFKSEMLKWPIVDHEEKLWPQVLQIIYKDAFEALTNISPFNAVVSMGVDLKNKKFIDPKRTWGMIYLKQNPILYFSHDTRPGNRAFYSLLDWPQINNDNDVIAWSSVDAWVKFFRGRIQKKANEMIQQSQVKLAEASKNLIYTKRLMNALSR